MFTKERFNEQNSMDCLSDMNGSISTLQLATERIDERPKSLEDRSQINLLENGMEGKLNEFHAFLDQVKKANSNYGKSSTENNNSWSVPQLPTVSLNGRYDEVFKMARGQLATFLTLLCEAQSQEPSDITYSSLAH
ncbi:hypothetical protein M422DRAFT_250121 [Sphaerobolus stellatus SS14]|nr:hypothetical protein M422DRAFT_250121 [Sphaerobolus stellatus SS14]